MKFSNSFKEYYHINLVAEICIRNDCRSVGDDGKVLIFQGNNSVVKIYTSNIYIMYKLILVEYRVWLSMVGTSQAVALYDFQDVLYILHAKPHSLGS